MIYNLDVFLWGKKIGSLVSSKKGYKQQICFYFDPEYIDAGWDAFPLRAPISGILSKNSLPVYPENGKEFGGLPSFIADSMPDHWGNLVFDEWAKAHKIRKKDLSPLDRLAYIGRRGMGALEFVPPTSTKLETPFKVEISELSKLAKTALENANNFHSVMTPDLMIENLFKVGTSAGGKRPKAVVNVNLETGDCYSGQVTTPIAGFTPMIVKFDEHTDVPSTRIEYSFYLMAMDAGMNIMPSRLLEGEREVHFLTERFDRKGNEKIHIQTLAAMNPLSDSYEDLFKTALRIEIIPGEMKLLYLQMVMNVLCGNVDDHNKNFSFMMNKDGVWHISPAYDFTFSVDPSAPYYINRHSMTLNGKNEDLTKDDLLEIGHKFGIKEASVLIEKAKEVASDYRLYALKAKVPENWIKIIETEIASRIESLGV